MLVTIENAILQRYPTVQIGYLAARVSVRKSDPFVEDLKQQLKGYLEEEGINETNFAIHPSLAIWRRIYEDDFHVKAKTYRSSIEALIRRVVTGKDLWNICNVVDLYNCFSILSLLPMGGYDLNRVSGSIQIRYAKEGERFLGLGTKEKIETRPNHVVYADEERVMCWLWNHKDCAETCIDESSEDVLFFIDSFDENKVRIALAELANGLEKIGCVPLKQGTLNRDLPQVEIEV